MAIPLVPVVAFILLAAFGTYRYFVHPVFLSPLSKFPAAHPLAAVSGVWILWQRFKGRNNRTTYAAHQRYGEVVRLGPNELSVNCVNGGIRTIYGGGFEKHEWYPNLFPSYGVINM